MTKSHEYVCSCVSPTAQHLPSLPSGHSSAEQLARRCRWYLYDPSLHREQAGVSAAGMGRVGIRVITGGGMGERGEEECGQGSSFPRFIPVQYAGFNL